MLHGALPPLQCSPMDPSNFPTSPANRCPSALASRIALLTIALAVLLAFLGTLRNDFVAWDDDQNLIRNTHYQGLGAEHLRWMFTTGFAGHYQPLTWLSFALESQLLWGVNPAGFHFTNLVLHLLTAVAFFFLTRRILDLVASDPWPVTSVPQAGGSNWQLAIGNWQFVTAALIAALFWSIHPLRVESVAWATERRDVLSGLWLVLTVLAYLRYATAQSKRWPWLACSLACYVLSLLSKAVGMTLPVVLLLLDIYPLRRCSVALHGRRLNADGIASATDPRSRIVWFEKLAFLIPAALAAAAALWAQSDVGALRSLADHPLALRIMQAFYGIVFYLGKTLWPVDLVPLYEQSPDVTPWHPAYIACALFVIAITAALWLARRRWPGVFIAWLAYLVLLSPMLGLAQAGPQLVADRYTYLPSMALAILLGAGFVLLLRAAPPPLPRGDKGGSSSRPWRVAATAATTMLVVCLIILTRAQTAIWSDTYTLWSTTIARRPDTPTAHANLAATLNARGEFQRARDHAEEALRRLPGNRTAHAALARAALELGDLEAADRHGRIALGIAERVGRIDTPTMVGLAIVQTHLCHLDEAEALYRRIIELEPSVAEWHFNLAGFLASQGRLADSIPVFEEALRLDPNHGESYYRLGTVWLKLGHPAKASDVWKNALLRGEALPPELKTRIQEALARLSAQATPP